MAIIDLKLVHKFRATLKIIFWASVTTAAASVSCQGCPGLRGRPSFSPSLIKSRRNTGVTTHPLEYPSTIESWHSPWAWLWNWLWNWLLRCMCEKDFVSEPKSPTSKRIVVCCDGTWQTSTSLSPEYQTPSNVTRLYRLIARGGSDRSGKTWTQIIYYNGGVGSGAATRSSKVLQGAFGWGYIEEFIKAYTFIVNNYCKGDELFFFGFSRGAHTVRSVAGLICDIGILTPESMPYLGEIFEIYQKKGPRTRLRDQPEWVKLCDKHPEIKWVHDPSNVLIQVIGVWDTVGAFGVPKLWLFKMECFRKKYQFLDTTLEHQVKHAFQALALDEFRAPYSPTLWTLQRERDNDHPPKKRTHLCQAWFPGAHINVGGGDPGSMFRYIKTNTLSNITLAWMLDRVQPFLALKWDQVEMELRQTQALADIQRGSGAIWKRNCFWEFLFREKIRTPGQYHHNNEDTFECIHPSVYFRQKGISDSQDGKDQYNPEALSGRKRQVHGDQGAIMWCSPDTHNNLPEFHRGRLHRSAENKLVEIRSNP